MSTDDTSRLMHAYFEALGTGHFRQFMTDDVTCTTIQKVGVIRVLFSVE